MQQLKIKTEITIGEKNQEHVKKKKNYKIKNDSIDKPQQNIKLWECSGHFPIFRRRFAPSLG